MYELAKETDISFLGAVQAQEKKQLNGLDKLEKRLLKAEKRKFKDRNRAFNNYSKIFVSRTKITRANDKFL